eukprot:tig00020592_g11703.t1
MRSHDDIKARTVPVAEQLRGRVNINDQLTGRPGPSICTAGHLSLGSRLATPARRRRPERSGDPSLACAFAPGRGARVQRRAMSRLLYSRRLNGGATGTQRRPIYSFSTRLAGRSASGGPSLIGVSTHDARAAGAAGTQRRPISCLGSRLTTPARGGGRNAAAALSRLGSRLTTPRGGGGRNAAAAISCLRPNSRRLRVRAVAAGVQRRPMSRLVARLAAPSRRARPGRSGEVNSQRPRGGAAGT